MKAGMLFRALSMLVVVALSASAQTAGSGSGCAQCAMDEASRRALQARTEKLRSEVDQLIREAAKQGADADTATLRQLSDALTKLRASERTLKFTTVAREPQIYRTAPVAPSGASYGFSTTSEMPSGYMGISLSGTTEVKPGDELVVIYRDTPIIEAVEPGSPADRAGLESGDLVLAYNGEELKGRTISLTKLLKPGAKVVVRVRRNGNTKDIPVIVAARSRDVTFQASRPRMIEPQVLVSPGFEFSFEDADTVTGASRARVSRIATPRADPAMLPPLLTGSGSAFAGAELTASNAALGEYFGTARGIIVLHVADGTPARRAGIQVGDVITQIEGEPVSRPSDFQRALVHSTSRRLELQVLRRKEIKQLTLKW